MKVPARFTRALELLALRGGDRLLEVGCGGGHLLELIARSAPPTVELVGIDRSALQVRTARRRLAAAEHGRSVRIEALELECAHSALCPPAFDHVVAVNVNVFWVKAGPAVASLRPLMRGGGTAILVYEAPTPAKAEAIMMVLRSSLAEPGLSALGIRVDESRSSLAERLCAVCITSINAAQIPDGAPAPSRRRFNLHRR